MGEILLANSPRGSASRNLSKMSPCEGVVPWFPTAWTNSPTVSLPFRDGRSGPNAFISAAAARLGELPEPVPKST